MKLTSKTIGPLKKKIEINTRDFNSIIFFITHENINNPIIVIYHFIHYILDLFLYSCRIRNMYVLFL